MLERARFWINATLATSVLLWWGVVGSCLKRVRGTS